MNNPIISVIVPVYNLEKYIDKCIESIIHQSFSQIEVILVNDGSNDKSSLICEKYSALDNRVTVIHKKNGGLSSARMEGFNCSVGRYITFVDGDDYIEKDYCKKLYDKIIDYKADIVSCNFIKFNNIYEDNSNTIKCNELIGDVIYNNMVEIDPNKFHVMIWGKIYDKLIFENIDFKILKRDFPQYYFDDILLTPIILKNINKVVVIKEQLYYYRCNNNGLTRSSGFKEYHMEIYKVKKYILYNVYNKIEYEKKFMIALKEYGNIIIKLYMALDKSDICIKSEFKKQLIAEFTEVYAELIKVKGFITKCSFLIFKTSPTLWIKMAGNYYYKNYNITIKL